MLACAGARARCVCAGLKINNKKTNKQTELDLHLSRERAALAPFSRISGVGHSGSWPPLHCGDSTKPAPEVVPGASLHSEALSPECGREHQETGDG